MVYLVMASVVIKRGECSILVQYCCLETNVKARGHNYIRLTYIVMALHSYGPRYLETNVKARGHNYIRLTYIVMTLHSYGPRYLETNVKARGPRTVAASGFSNMTIKKKAMTTYAGPIYMCHNYIYMCHNSIRHNYIRHNYVRHNYTCHTPI